MGCAQDFKHQDHQNKPFMNKYIIIYIKEVIRIFIVLLLLSVVSCRKLVDVKPPVTGVMREEVYSSNTTAIAVLNDLYSKISSGFYPYAGVNSIFVWNGLLADEFTLWSGSSSPDAMACFTNSLRNAAPQVWPAAYNYIYICNAVIDGVTNSTSLNEDVRKQLLGEAKFMRAFVYFNLVNLYGNVPLVLVTDYKTNSLLPRVTEQEIYNQIIEDLNEAKTLLADKFKDVTLLNETFERTRPNKWAASALLARVYLYRDEWEKADLEASEVINQSNLFSISDVALNEVFLANSREAIWQIQPVTDNPSNSQIGKLMTIPSTGPSDENPVYLSSFLLDSFEVGDLRRQNWVDSVVVLLSEGPPAVTETYHYSSKYKVNDPTAMVTEYTMMLRLAEQYLIRAEARAQQNNISGAQEDINVIRSRAELSDITTTDKIDLLKAIWHERKIELFTESGHRWFDLKRTKQIDIVMPHIASAKAGNWDPNWKYFPIPQGEITKNPNMDQNEGYQ